MLKDFWQVFEEGFAVDAMRAEALDTVVAGFDAEHVSAVLRWLRTPLGRRITEYESAAATIEGLAGGEAYQAMVLASPPPPERIELVDRLEEVVDSVGMQVAIVIENQLALARFVRTINVGTLMPSISDVQNQLRALEPQWRQQLSGQISAMYLYTYRELSDEDFESYVLFHESPAGRWYASLSGKSILAALGAATGRTMGGLRSWVEKTRQATEAGSAAPDQQA